MPRVRFPIERVMRDADNRGIAWPLVDADTVLLPYEVLTREDRALVEVRGRFHLPDGDTDEIMMVRPSSWMDADDAIARIVAIVRRVAGREIVVNGEVVTA